MAVECDYSCEYHCTENWTIQKKCEVIMSKKKWHENIPEQGVLINIKDDDFEETIVFKRHHAERFDTDELNLCVPVTAQEWWQFAPWQPIETAPRDGTEILLRNNRTIKQGYFSDQGGFTLDNPTQWLPLPQLG